MGGSFGAQISSSQLLTPLKINLKLVCWHETTVMHSQTYGAWIKLYTAHLFQKQLHSAYWKSKTETLAHRFCFLFNHSVTVLYHNAFQAPIAFFFFLKDICLDWDGSRSERFGCLPKALKDLSFPAIGKYPAGERQTAIEMPFHWGDKRVTLGLSLHLTLFCKLIHTLTSVWN